MKFVIRQIELQTEEPLGHEPSSFEMEIAINELKRYKSVDTEEILVEVICSAPVYRKSEKTDCSNCRGISLL
jgi:hypothetical protein